VLAHRTDSASGATISELAVLRYGELPALQGSDRPGIVHRLDAGTSGVMVLARTEEAFRDMMRQFRERSVSKTYLALVYGEPRFDSGWIEAPIERALGDTSRMKTAKPGEGRAAQTYYEVRERFRGLALLAVQPKTGRTHQIRVHLASVGMHLVGDKLYKRRGGHLVRLPPEAPVPPRQCLHAFELRFVHPATKEPVVFQAPLAEDFEKLLAWAREHLA
jgi:23S rRNA pseudouridine1911/1915/1917 synthase